MKPSSASLSRSPGFVRDAALFFITFLALFSGLSSLGAAEPEAGTLDTSFSGDGWLSFNLPEAYRSAGTAFGQDASGRTVWAANRQKSSEEQGPFECVVSRFLEDGTPDLTFGQQGAVSLEVPLPSPGLLIKKLCLLQNGKILIAGQTQFNLVLIQLLENGQPDTAFSGDGITLYATGTRYVDVGDVIQRPDGAVFILLTATQDVGYQPRHLQLVRCTETGLADPIMRGVPAHIASSSTSSRGVALIAGPNNDLLIGGSLGENTYNSREQPLILCVQDDVHQSYMQPFTSGYLNEGYVNSLTLDHQGMLLAGIFHRSGGDTQVDIARYQTNGKLDPLFGTGGKCNLIPRIYKANLATPFTGIAVQADGRILVVHRWTGGQMWRLTPSGALDTTFGSKGSRIIPHQAPSNSMPLGLLSQADGKILLAAVTDVSSATWTLSRLHGGTPVPVAVPQITQQPQAPASVLFGQPFTLQVAATSAGDLPLTYAWRKNGRPLHRDYSSGGTTPAYTVQQATVQQKPYTSQAGPDDVYTVAIGNANGWTVSDPVTIHVSYPPVFKSFTPPVAVLPEGGTYIDMEIRGRNPIRYRLLREGVEIAEDLASDSLEPTHRSLNMHGPGSYELILSNSDGETRSGIFEVTLQSDPHIWIGPAGLYRVGEEGVRLNAKIATFADSDRIRLDWRQNGKVVLKDWRSLGMHYYMPLEEAGTYTATLRIPGKSYTSAPVEIGVVDPAPQTVYMAAGKKVTLTAVVAGNRLTYAWKKDGELLTASTRIPKVTDKTLVIAKPELADAGTYLCTVTHPNGQTLDAGAITLIADVTAPVPPASVTALADGRLGEAYQFDLDMENRTVAYAITGLPKGLVFDKATGIITGQPMAAGDFKVKITATNLAGSTKFELPLKILPLAHSIAGVYEGIEKGPSYCGISVKVTVTSTATFSASVRVQNDEGKSSTRSFTGHLTWEEGGTYRFSPDYPSTDGDRAYTHLYFALSPQVSGPDDYPFSGSVDSHIGGGDFQGTRKGSWKSGSAPSAAFSGYYTVALGEYGGVASFTVSPTGTFTFLGKLPSGTVLSCGTWLDEQGRFPVSIWRQGTLKRYKGWGIITPHAASSYRHSGVRSQDLEMNYNRMTGFFGTKYLPPNIPGFSSPLMMNIPAEAPGNVTVSLAGYALHTVPFTGSLTAKHQLIIPPLGKPSISDSVQVTRLVFNPSKGTFTAGAQMHYFDPGDEQYAGTRRFSFQGLTTRHPDTLQPAAYGFAAWKGRAWDDWEERYESVLYTERIKITPAP